MGSRFSSCSMNVMLCLLLAASVFISCKPSVDRKYIQPSVLEDILYDYHLAEEVVRLSGGDTIAMLSFKTNILNKYGVTEAELDSSLLYYSRHTKQLHDVYKNIVDRFTNEAMAQGASVTERNKFGNISSSSDTTDIWNGSRMLVLYQQEASNIHTFNIKADTAFHKGDKIILDFDTRFIYQDGVRTAAAVMALRLGNDSVVSRTVNISTTSRYHIQLEDINNLGIKEIMGYFLVNENNNIPSSTTTLKMLSIYNIRMIRMHRRQIIPTAVSDSVKLVKTDSAIAMPKEGKVPSVDKEPKQISPNRRVALPAEEKLVRRELKRKES